MIQEASTSKLAFVYFDAGGGHRSALDDAYPSASLANLAKERRAHYIIRQDYYIESTCGLEPPEQRFEHLAADNDGLALKLLFEQRSGLFALFRDVVGHLSPLLLPCY